MGNPRSFTTKFNANNEALRSALKAKGITSARKRKIAIASAAGGRIDLSNQAKLRIAARRSIQQDGAK